MASPGLSPNPLPVHPAFGGEPGGGAQVRDDVQRLRLLWTRLATLACCAADGLATLLGILAGYRIYSLLPIGRHFQYGARHLGEVLVIGAAFALAIFQWQGLYRCRGSLLHVREFEIILRSIALAIVGTAAISALVHSVPVPRLLFLTCLPTLAAAVIVERLLLHRLWPRMRRSRSLVSQALIVGTTETGLRLFKKLAQSPHYGIHVHGFVATHLPSGSGVFFAPSFAEQRQKAEVVGKIHEIDAILANRPEIDSLVIADELAPGVLDQVLAVVRERALVLRFVPHTGGFYSHWIKYSDVDGIPLGTCRVPGKPALMARLFKRMLDLAIAATLFIALMPLMLLIALLIRLDTPGPILFRQQRVGQGGQLFTIFKFRTMRADQCRDAVSPKDARDPRITRCGRWLRRLSLDELPQLINVLRGDMSLVGPRPEMPFVVEGYSELERERLRAKPGITGLWQISADRARPIHENIEYDLYYLEHQSVFLDLAILLNTAIFVTRGIGAW